MSKIRGHFDVLHDVSKLATSTSLGLNISLLPKCGIMGGACILAMTFLSV